MNEQQEHYFSQEGLQNLKADIDLVFVIGADHKLVKKGKRFFARCPIHSDDNLSLVISPKKNLWYCFGACRRGGSIVDWVMASEKLKLVVALAVLAERYPFLAQKGQVTDAGLNQEVPPDHSLEKHQAILLQIIDHYHATIFDQPKAIRYLRSWGISHKIIRKYKIGYSDSSLAQALVKKINSGDEILSNEMSNAGLLEFIAQRGIRERFDGQIIFPLLDEGGNLVQMLGRAVPEQIKIALVQTLVS